MIACVFAVALFKGVHLVAMSAVPTSSRRDSSELATNNPMNITATTVPTFLAVTTGSPMPPAGSIGSVPPWQQPAPPSAKVVRYNRKLCSGLGDRIAVILNVAAFARTMNASCFMFWCDENKGATDQYRKGRYYGIDAIRRYSCASVAYIFVARLVC